MIYPSHRPRAMDAQEPTELSSTRAFPASGSAVTGFAEARDAIALLRIRSSPPKSRRHDCVFGDETGKR